MTDARTLLPVLDEPGACCTLPTAPPLDLADAQRLAEQLRSAIEWRDQLCTYFWRKSGIADERGRALYR